MKYCEYLNKKINPEWKFFYINYKLLKQIIKNENSMQFWNIINLEVEKVNSFFNIIIKYEKENKNIDDFIILNYMALFKLIKKYDKHLCKNNKIKFFNTISKQDFYSYYITRKREQKDTKLVIFDKDGTLVNNEKIFAPWTEKIVNSISNICKFNSDKLYKHLGYNPLKKTFNGDSIVARGTNDEIRNAITSFIKMQYPDISNQNSKDFVDKNWIELTFESDDVIPFGNLTEIFQKLKNNNIKIAICTSDDRKPTINMLQTLKVIDFIDFIACGDDDISSKPSPEPIWNICKNINLLPSQTIMIGDTISDIQAGINSRCKQVYGVLTGGYSTNHLQNADKIFNNITQAVDFILKK